MIVILLLGVTIGLVLASPFVTKRACQYIPKDIKADRDYLKELKAKLNN